MEVVTASVFEQEQDERKKRRRERAGEVGDRGALFLFFFSFSNHG